MKYKLLSIDAWADGEGGWTWNQWFTLEDSVEFAEPTSRAVLKWLRDNDYLGRESIGRVRVTKHQFGDAEQLVIEELKDERPLFAFEPLPEGEQQ